MPRNQEHRADFRDLQLRDSASAIVTQSPPSIPLTSPKMSFLGLHAGTGARLAGVIGFTRVDPPALPQRGADEQIRVPSGMGGLFGADADGEVLRSSGVFGFHQHDCALSRELPRISGLQARADPQYYPTVRSYLTKGPSLPFKLPTTAVHHPRQLLVSAMMLLWAGRLGYFLFQVSDPRRP